MTFFVGFLQVFSPTSARSSKWSPDIQKQNTQRHPQTNPLLAAARESGHIPPSFSNKAINAVPPPVWPWSQQYHSRCSVPIGHGLSNTIPAVPSPLATVSATPYPLFRPHWPRSQLPAIPAVSSPLATISALPYQLSRPHWPRSQLRYTRCLVAIGYELSDVIPAVSSPLATISATPPTHTAVAPLARHIHLSRCPRSLTVPA